MTIEIEIPTTCPSCSSVLKQVNSQLFCRNKDCPAQSTKKVQAFAKKLRIKGLGPASVSKLGFVHPIEIYETDLDTFVEVLGEKIGQKLYDEVQNSRVVNFATFLSALSIPLIGDTASKKIAVVTNSISHLFEIELHNVLGVIGMDNLMTYLEENEMKILELESYFQFQVATNVRVIQDQGNVCITGKLNDFSNRAKAKEFLEEHGYTVTTGLSGKTDYLVCEDGSISSKSKKAESLGVPIVTIAELIN
jgi:DNA ligase (NAD+)